MNHQTEPHWRLLRMHFADLYEVRINHPKIYFRCRNCGLDLTAPHHHPPSAEFLFYLDKHPTLCHARLTNPEDLGLIV